MESSDQKYLRGLIAEGEHQRLDFKFEINDARKIARTLSAFSNTDGGRLLIGVKDNGRIRGVRSDEEYYMVESAATLYCNPEVRFKSRNISIEGKQVLDTHELVAPEGMQGSGRIVIGMYDTETFERLLFSHGWDEVELAVVEFE